MPVAGSAPEEPKVPHPRSLRRRGSGTFARWPCGPSSLGPGPAAAVRSKWREGPDEKDAELPGRHVSPGTPAPAHRAIRIREKPDGPSRHHFIDQGSWLGPIVIDVRAASNTLRVSTAGGRVECPGAPQGHRAIHMEEVGGEHRGCLCVQELAPAGVGVPPWLRSVFCRRSATRWPSRLGRGITLSEFIRSSAMRTAGTPAHDAGSQ